MTYQASAPGRAGIIGSPSDIYGGFMVSCSIPARATCRLTFSGQERLPEDTRLWDAATKRFPIARCEIDWTTDVPRSSGLSGSTALLAATLLCVLQARKEAPNLDDPEAKIRFAELVRDIELRDAGVVCGYQDAYMIVHGGVQAMDFAGKHPIDGGPPARLRPIELEELPFLLVTTGVERLSGSVHGPMRERWLVGDPEVRRGIGRIAEIGRLGAGALERRDWEALGQLMAENQAITRSLGGSGEAVDDLIQAALDEGALGARLAGAGLGGTIICITFEPDDLERRLRARGYSRFMRPCAGSGARVEAP